MNEKVKVYGGQAVIEGVMMRSRRAMAVAVRDPAGEIQIISHRLTGPLRGRIANIPFLRGVVGLIDAFGIGYRSLMYSGAVAAGEDAEYDEPVAWGMIGLSVAMGIGMFFILPALIGQGAENWMGISGGMGNIVEGIARLIVVLVYIWLIGFMPDVRRIYGYHGAEHKTIHAFEANAELTPLSVARFPREHPRCGTAFLLVVVVMSVLIFAALGPLPLLMRLATRLILLPVLAGLAYEYLRITAKNVDNSIVRLLVLPSLALQRLTTREPDEKMLAVAITAFEAMRKIDGAEGKAVSLDSEIGVTGKG